MKKEETQFISLADAAKLTNYSQDYISLLCRQRKMRAEKLGRNWVTTKDWVYSYIDNTEGKGRSVVPVNIKKEEVETEADRKESVRKSGAKNERPFFAYNLLECVLFCMTFLIWSVNVYAFTNFLQTGDFDSVRGSTKISYVNPDAAILTGSEVNASVETDAGLAASVSGDAGDVVDRTLTCTDCTEQDSLDDLLSFEAETDAAVIASKQEAIAAIFGSEIEAKIYKGFATLYNVNSPEVEYLYITE